MENNLLKTEKLSCLFLGLDMLMPCATELTTQH